MRKPTVEGPILSGLSFSKRGAMFGLDARIALAIFAALGLLTGAALFAAIKQSRATTLIGEFESLAQGYTQLILDVKRDAWIAQMLGNPGWEGWNGPYTRLESSVTHPLYPTGVMSIDRYGDADWNNGAPVAATLTNCWNWVRLGGQNVEILRVADKITDGGIDGDRGKLRYNDTHPDPATPIAAWYLISPCLNGPI